ncbi:MAG: outer membrane beta-barrel protein [Crocinitomicaceae bacterium]|nr:outer membrane beta-barrel protein [Crocinitomicaceae bacterium]
MKKILPIVLLLISAGAFAQYQFDYGLKIGAANYLGDIGGKELTRRDFVPDMHLRSTRTALGGYGRYKFSKRFAIGANLDWLQITDRDAMTTNPARRGRNMNFRNNMIELGVRGEFTLWYDNDVGNRGYYNPDYKLYAFAGVAGFRSNPQGRIYNEGELDDPTWYNLREWKTEGQEKPYSQFGVAIPAGIGMYFTFKKTWRIGWEVSWRTTFTDYLDDISTTYADPSKFQDPKAEEFVNQSYQGLIDDINDANVDGQPLAVNNFRYNPGFETKRGDPLHNDSYLTTQFTIGRVIRGRSQFYKAKYSWLKNRSGVRRSRAKF